MPIPTNRTTSNTPAEHVSDHNLLHAFYNSYEGFPPSSFASASHTHAASSITSGLIDTARLGTGVAQGLVGPNPYPTWLRGDQAWAGVNLIDLADHDETNSPIDGWVLTKVQGTNIWKPVPTGSGGALIPGTTNLFTATSGSSVTETVWQAAAVSSGGSGRLTGPATPQVTLQDNTLNLESSGAAVSQQFGSGSLPVMYLHNDQNDTYGANPAQAQPAPLPAGYAAKTGNVARFFAVAMNTGAHIKTFRLRNAANTAYHANIDFEDMSTVKVGATTFLFFFDTNSQTQGGNPGPWSFLYRCVETTTAGGTDPQDVTTTRLRISWANVNAGAGAYCEGMFVDPADGFLYLFQSRNVLADPGGAPRAAVYKSDVRVDTAADDATITMTTIGTFPVARTDASTTASEWCAAADIAPDRSCFLIHTYANVGGQYDRILLYNLSGGISITTALSQTPRLALNDGTGRDPTSETQGEATAFLPGSYFGLPLVGYVRTGEKVSGGAPILLYQVQSTSSGTNTYTLSKADENNVLWAACSSGVNGTINLPAASAATAPRLAWIKRQDSFPGQTMTLHPGAGNNVDGTSADIALASGDTLLLWNVQGLGWFTLGPKSAGAGGGTLPVFTYNSGSASWVQAPSPSIFLQNPGDPDPESGGPAVPGDIVWRQYPT